MKAYNDAIELCTKLKDNGSREMLDGILVESEVDWLETQLGLIKEVGLQLYLQHQIGEEAGGGHYAALRHAKKIVASGGWVPIQENWFPLSALSGLLVP